MAWPISENFSSAPAAGTTTVGAAISYSGGFAIPSATGTDCGWWHNDQAPTADHFVEATIVTSSDITDVYFNLHARWDGIDTNIGGDAYVLQQNFGDLIFYSANSSSFNTLYTGTGALSTPGTYTLRIECVGSTITAKLNGSTVYTGTDTAVTTGTKVGITMYSLTTVNDTKVDSFSAGGFDVMVNVPDTGVAQAFGITYGSEVYGRGKVEPTVGAATATGTANNALVRTTPQPAGPGTNVILKEDGTVRLLQDGSYHLLQNGTASGVTDDFTFTGADGASWGPGWTFTQGTGDILTNRGRMTTLAVPDFDGVSAYYEMGMSDVDLRIDVTIPQANDQYPEIRFRFSGSGDFIRLLFEPHNDVAQLYPFVGYSQGSQIGSNLSFPFTAGDTIHSRIISVGNDHKIRMWSNSDPEPTTWNAEFTNSTGAGNTQVMIRTVNAPPDVAITNYWDNFSFQAADFAPAGAGAATGSASNATVTIESAASAAASTSVGQDATNNVTSTIGGAAASGAGQNSPLEVKPSASDAVSTGAAFDDASTVAGAPGDASGTGSGQDTAPTVGATAIDAAATSAASDSPLNVQPNAVNASSTGTGYDATVSTASSDTNAAAGDAASTGTGYDASTTVAPTGSDGSGTGSGQDNTATINVTAVDAAATGTAYDASAGAVVSAAAGDAAATGSGFDATTTIQASGTDAASSGAGSDASNSIGSSTLTATASAQAQDNNSTVSPTVVDAAATGVAYDLVDESYQVNAGDGASTGTAFNATVLETTSAAAVTATSTGTGFDASITLDAAGVGTATGASTSNNADTGVSSAPGTGASAGSANDSTNSVATSGGQATATGSGNDAQGGVGAAAEAGSATGSGSDATKTVSPTSESAAATGVGYDASVLSGADALAQATAATATGTAFDGSLQVSASSSDGAGSGTGLGATDTLAASSATATATGSASNAFVLEERSATAQPIDGYGVGYGPTTEQNTSSITAAVTAVALDASISTTAFPEAGYALAIADAYPCAVTARANSRGQFWDGARWVSKKSRYWNGERWVDVVAKRWDGQRWRS